MEIRIILRKTWYLQLNKLTKYYDKNCMYELDLFRSMYFSNIFNFILLICYLF